MSTLSYETQQHRLRVAGVCDEDEARWLRDEVLARTRDADVLIVDLTAVTGMAREVGSALVAARAAATHCRVTLVRKSGSAVDRCLHEVEPRLSSRLSG